MLSSPQRCVGWFLVDPSSVPFFSRLKSGHGRTVTPHLLLHLELLSNNEKQSKAFHSQATKSWIVQPENILQWFPGSLGSMTASTGERTGKSVCLHSPSLESHQARRILNAWPQHQLQNNCMGLLSMPGFTHCFCLSWYRFVIAVLWKEAACTCLITPL